MHIYRILLFNPITIMMCNMIYNLTLMSTITFLEMLYQFCVVWTSNFLQYSNILKFTRKCIFIILYVLYCCSVVELYTEDKNNNIITFSCSELIFYWPNKYYFIHCIKILKWTKLIRILITLEVPKRGTDVSRYYNCSVLKNSQSSYR